MKKRIAMVILVVGCLLLSACSVTISSGESKGKETESIDKGTYQIGDVILEEGNDVYYYGGIVYDSVVINVVKNELYQSAHTIPLYIEVSVKSPVQLPESETAIVIEDVDRSKGTVSISMRK